MTKGEGQSKVDAVEAGELNLVLIGLPAPVLSVKYAYANAESGTRYGYGNKNMDWSEETLQALARLVELVERDICASLFPQGATTGVVVASPDTAGGIPSL